MLHSGWAELGGGKAVAAQEHMAAVGGESCSAFCCFVLCILLICIVVVTVPFACCSVKLPLSQPTSFCLFLSILLRTPVEGGAAERPRGAFITSRSQTITMFIYSSLFS